MRERPTLVLVHGGPGSYDHSYFKPAFAALTDVAQVVYLDLRDHGRSSWGDPTAWSFEQSADDLVAFCDALDITRPIVLGHSMGRFVAMLAGARHPGHAGGLVAPVDDGPLRPGAGWSKDPELSPVTRSPSSLGGSYAGETVSDGEWSRVLAAFGPEIPMARRPRPSHPERRRRGGRHGPRAPPRPDRRAGHGVFVSDAGRRGRARPRHPGRTRPARSPARCAPASVGWRSSPDAGHFTWLDAPERSFALITGVHEPAYPAITGWQERQSDADPRRVS